MTFGRSMEEFWICWIGYRAGDSNAQQYETGLLFHTDTNTDTNTNTNTKWRLGYQQSIPIKDSEYPVYFKDDRQEEAKKEAQTCYGRADDFTIPACSPTKLSIILNYSVFVNEVMGQQEDAIKMTEKILSDALEKIDDLPDDDFKEAKNIIDVLKENLQIWKDNQDRLAGKNPAENW